MIGTTGDTLVRRPIKHREILRFRSLQTHLIKVHPDCSDFIRSPYDFSHVTKRSNIGSGYCVKPRYGGSDLLDTNDTLNEDMGSTILTILNLSQSIVKLKYNSMSSFIYYKFKSNITQQNIPFDGSAMSVSELKVAIRIQNGMKSNDFDLIIMNTNGKEYSPNDLISAYSSVIVRRTPMINSKPLKKTIHLEKFTKSDPYKNMRNQEEENKFKNINLATADMTEDQKQDFVAVIGSKTYNVTRRFLPSAIPSTYVCNKCNIGGHWITECPGIPDRNGNILPPNKVKRPSGIPSTNLMEVDSTTPNSYLTIDGRYVVNTKNYEAYMKGKKEKIPFSKEENPPQIIEVEKKPLSLICEICSELFNDPVSTPCCHKTYCRNCAMNNIFDEENITFHKCPNCKNTIDIFDSLMENRFFVRTIREWKLNKLSKEEVERIILENSEIKKEGNIYEMDDDDLTDAIFSRTDERDDITLKSKMNDKILESHCVNKDLDIIAKSPLIVESDMKEKHCHSESNKENDPRKHYNCKERHHDDYIQQRSLDDYKRQRSREDNIHQRRRDDDRHQRSRDHYIRERSRDDHKRQRSRDHRIRQRSRDDHKHKRSSDNCIRQRSRDDHKHKRSSDNYIRKRSRDDHEHKRSDNKSIQYKNEESKNENSRKRSRSNSNDHKNNQRSELITKKHDILEFERKKSRSKSRNKVFKALINRNNKEERLYRKDLTRRSRSRSYCNAEEEKSRERHNHKDSNTNNSEKYESIKDKKRKSEYKNENDYIKKRRSLSAASDKPLESKSDNLNDLNNDESKSELKKSHKKHKKSKKSKKHGHKSKHSKKSKKSKHHHKDK